jgi:hypothetical protein
MLKSALVRAATIPAVSLVLFGAIALFAVQRASVEAVPATSSGSAMQTMTVPDAASVPDEEDDITDYSFVFTNAGSSAGRQQPHISNVP